MEIRFYHMEKSTLEQTLPALLSKASDNGFKIMVKSNSAASAEKLNAHLWSHKPNSFLPHGSEKDGNPDKQPIWMTDKDDNENNADMLVLTHASEHNDIEQFKLCCEMLDGNNHDHVQSARMRWKSYKEKGYEMTYWQQGANGGWEKKASENTPPKA